MSEEEQNAEMGKWFAYSESLRQAGVHVAGEALHPTPTASTVMVPNGEPLVTDGPFAETKEQLGGFYIIDVPDQGRRARVGGQDPVGAVRPGRGARDHDLRGGLGRVPRSFGPGEAAA